MNFDRWKLRRRDKNPGRVAKRLRQSASASAKEERSGPRTKRAKSIRLICAIITPVRPPRGTDGWLAEEKDAPEPLQLPASKSAFLLRPFWSGRKIDYAGRRIRRACARLSRGYNFRFCKLGKQLRVLSQWVTWLEVPMIGQTCYLCWMRCCKRV